MYNSYLNLNQINPIIVSSAQGDVSGDKTPDNIYLTGIKALNSPFVQKITLMIQDGNTGVITSIPLKTDVGYNPRLVLRDFTGNGVNDILISIVSGGSGGITYYYIYSYLGNIPKLLFDYDKFNETYKYQVTYKDYYKVAVINTTENTKFIVDISSKDKEYLNELYDQSAKLKAPIEGFVSPLSGLYPIDYNSDGVYELLAYQRVSGRYAADALGFIQTSLKYNGREFALFNQYVAISGSEI